jgi:outer membrane protein assembly factor BamB/tetratricopeptide (TPR) repeat protein
MRTPSRRPAALGLALLAALPFAVTAALPESAAPRPANLARLESLETRPGERALDARLRQPSLTLPESGLDLKTEPRFAARFRDLADAADARDWERTTAVLLQLFAADDALVPLVEPGPGGREVRRLAALRAEARRRLAELPSDGRDAYRAKAGAEAARALADARADGSPARLAAVASRFPYTDAAADALQEMALREARAGHGAFAALHFRRLREQRALDRWSPETLFEAAVVHRRLGDNEGAAVFEARLRQRRADDLLRKLGESKALDARFAEAARPRADWPMVGGSADRAAEPQGDIPVLDARWRAQTVHQGWGGKEGASRALLGQAEAALRERGRPLLPAAQPIAVVSDRDGRMVYCRSHWGLHAFSADTGRLRWESSSPWSLDRAFEDTGKAGAFTQWAAAWLQNRPEALVDNSLVGCLSSDGHCLFAVEDLEILPRLAEDRPPPRASGPIAEALARNRLWAFDLHSGKLIWQAGDAFRNPELNDAVFLGAPLPLDGRLFVLAEWKQELRLLQLDPRRGTLLASRTLAAPGRKALEDGPRRTRAAHLAFADGLIVCPTNGGALLAADVVVGDLVWAHSYRVEVPPAAIRPGVPAPPPPQPPRNWPVTTAPVLRDGLVFSAPADGLDLLCLRLRDGSLVWRAERADKDLYFAGVTDGKALVVADGSVRALDANTGRPVWTLATGEPSGTGVAADGVYYLPLRKAAGTGEPEVLAIDVKRGVALSHTRSRTRETPGNLLMFGPHVVSQTATEIVVYPQLKAKREEIDGLLRANPNDPTGLTERGGLRLDGGDLPGAVEDLRKALKNDPPPALQPRLKALLFDALRESLVRDFAAAEKYLDEADKLTQGEPEAEARRRKALLLAAAGRGYEKQGKRQEALKAYLDLARLGPNAGELPSAEDPTVRQAADVWARGRIRAVLKAAPPEERAKLEKWLLDGLLDQGPPPPDGKGGPDEPSVLPGPETAAGREARLLLAAKLVEEGKYVEADRLLQEVRRVKDDPERAARAVEQLALLHMKRGQPREAVAYYRILGKDFARVKVRDGKTGADLFEEILTDKRLLPYLEEP